MALKRDEADPPERPKRERQKVFCGIRRPKGPEPQERQQDDRRKPACDPRQSVGTDAGQAEGRENTEHLLGRGEHQDQDRKRHGCHAGRDIDVCGQEENEGLLGHMGEARARHQPHDRRQAYDTRPSHGPNPTPAGGRTLSGQTFTRSDFGSYMGRVAALAETRVPATSISKPEARRSDTLSPAHGT